MGVWQCRSVAAALAVAARKGRLLAENMNMDMDMDVLFDGRSALHFVLAHWYSTLARLLAFALLLTAPASENLTSFTLS